MKKTFKKIAALVLATVITAAPVSALADSSYTYNYDYWENYQECPDTYTVASVITSSDLGLEVKMKNPQSLTAYGDYVYVTDTGNNRILELKRTSTEKFEVERIIDQINGCDLNTFSAPKDFVISEDGNYFVADTGNARIVKFDKDLNYIMEFTKPTDETLDPALVFAPTKLVVDTAERVYCIADGINQGLVKYECDGKFSGFIGATPVTYSFIDYIWKKLASEAQRAQMENFVPTEYSNLYMDYEGFIYTTASKIEEDDIRSEQSNPVRKLNLMGSDILIRNGNYPIIGDLYFGAGGGTSGPSRFCDITVFTNDIYACLDKNRGRIFIYDDQGRLVSAFGGLGNQDGYFRSPSSIERINYDLLVLDELDCAITVFIPTEFGQTIYDAVDLFDDGDYDASGEAWQKVKDINGNYDLAYIGLGRSLLRQKRYKEAMEYFEVKYDAENYSKAFKQYRKEWVEEHIGTIVIVLVLLFAVPLTIGKIKSIKHEIDVADIFNN